MTEQEKREKVIRGLGCCNSLHNDSIVKCATDCPYWEFDAKCRGFVMRDALALLKSQEPVEPLKRENQNGFTYYHCAKCDTVLMAFQPKFCHNCGQAVKWE